MKEKEEKKDEEGEDAAKYILKLIDVLHKRIDIQRQRTDILFSLRRYDKAHVITNAALILLLLVYIVNETSKHLS